MRRRRHSFFSHKWKVVELCGVELPSWDVVCRFAFLMHLFWSYRGSRVFRFLLQLGSRSEVKRQLYRAPRSLLLFLFPHSHPPPHPWNRKPPPFLISAWWLKISINNDWPSSSSSPSLELRSKKWPESDWDETFWVRSQLENAAPFEEVGLTFFQTGIIQPCNKKHCCSTWTNGETGEVNNSIELRIISWLLIILVPSWSPAPRSSKIFLFFKFTLVVNASIWLWNHYLFHRWSKAALHSRQGVRLTFPDHMLQRNALPSELQPDSTPMDWKSTYYCRFSYQIDRESRERIWTKLVGGCSQEP